VQAQLGLPPIMQDQDLLQLLAVVHEHLTQQPVKLGPIQVFFLHQPTGLM
jgi:hypothetical protein